MERQRGPSLRPHTQLDTLFVSPRHQSAAPCISGPPCPEWRFQPVAFLRQVGNRMVLATDSARLPIGVNALVVDRVKARQLAEQLARKPGEGLRAANTAHRDFQVMTAPAPLPFAPGERKSFSKQVRL